MGLRILVLALALLVLPSVSYAQLATTRCPAGAAPTFNFGFAELRGRVGDAVGEATTCEFADPNGSGDVHQRTSTGLAFWRKSTNTPTFTNGYDHWGLLAGELVYWVGDRIDPPGVIPPSLPATPTATVTRAPTFTPATQSTATPTGTFRRWTGGGYAVMAETAAWPAMDFLLAHDLAWPVAAMSKHAAAVAFYPLTDAFGLYRPTIPEYGPTIFLHTSLKTASADAVAAVLVHEATHLVDDKAGLLRTSRQCYESELRAFTNASTFWQTLWGRNGKPNPTHAVERQLNNLLEWWAAGQRDALDAAIADSYRNICAGRPAS